jgi:type VI secretion system protein ImpK
MTTTTRPSLFGADIENTMPALAVTQQARSLSDLLYDGFFMLFLLKQQQTPGTADDFRSRIQEFLADFERDAKKLNASADDIFASKYAFCAAVDESILSSNFKMREAWERQPLQMALFGEQLAGENFFRHLEKCRAQGAVRLAALEVFHLCLLLGFQGKYRIEGTERLAYLISRVGDEIAAMKGKRAPFAPHWQLPDQVAHTLKRETPLWSIGAVFFLIGLLAFSGLSSSLSSDTDSAMAVYNDTINLGPKAANLTISLP